AHLVAVATGTEAIAAATAREFDVVLTDLGLPDVAGDAVIRHVRATARNHPKVIVVTGYGEPLIGRARRAGADVVLTKPVAWSALLNHLAGSRRTPVAA
ncbi:MAG TPA: response regulator, partial [Methylomirabilota bacterium]|nr:response regulator [Methylomirabilota bacterium]